MSDISETLLWMAILTLPILPNFWCIWHAARHSFPGPTEQMQWIRVGVFVPVLGGLIYFFVGMRRAGPLPPEGSTSENDEYDDSDDEEDNTDGQPPRTGDTQ